VLRGPWLPLRFLHPGRAWRGAGRQKCPTGRRELLGRGFWLPTRLRRSDRCPLFIMLLSPPSTHPLMFCYIPRLLSWSRSPGWPCSFCFNPFPALGGDEISPHLGSVRYPSVTLTATYLLCLTPKPLLAIRSQNLRGGRSCFDEGDSLIKYTPFPWLLGLPKDVSINIDSFPSKGAPLSREKAFDPFRCWPQTLSVSLAPYSTRAVGGVPHVDPVFTCICRF